MKSVTVVLTTKNDEKIIKKCVDSLIHQTYKNRKIYVTVATSSTDKTYDILKRYGKKIILERIEGNRPESYNKMLKKVKSDYVAFTDGDAVCDKNWLKELISSFKPGVVAVGGMIKNPKSENKLQDLVGRELEYRFSKLPKEVARLPTMNLCVVTKFAKMEKFDESLRVAQETDWGYSLNKHGKTLFNIKAVVWHYHRATWKSYFKQQYLYGENVPKVYLKKHNLKKIKGDEVSDIMMPFQIGMLGLIGLLFLAGFWSLDYVYMATIPTIALFASYLEGAHKLSNSIPEFFYLILIFFVRSFAWTLGILMGLVKVF